jgi:hypothetical protein
MGVPFGSLAVHMPACVLQNWVAAQSLSIVHVAPGAQVPFAAQTPDWHTVPPLAAVHGPSPFARPHSLSVVSQTPEAHTAVPTAVVHMPLRSGVWPVRVGIMSPFGSLASQVMVSVLQNCVDAQSLSIVHAGAGAPQSFVVMLHIPERQMAAPTPVEHVPVRGGVWFEIVGIGVPSGSFPVHVMVCVSQNCVLAHWLSIVQVGGAAAPQSFVVMLHVPDTQTAVPTAALHVPVSAGVCPEIMGTGVPSGSLAVHAFAWVLQNCVLAHWLSIVQPGVMFVIWRPVTIPPLFVTTTESVF